VSPREWNLRVEDILQAIGRIAQYTAYPHIPWDEMRGMRNILIHEYFLVSVPTLWQTVTQNLPPLALQLQRILDENR